MASLQEQEAGSEIFFQMKHYKLVDFKLWRAESRVLQTGLAEVPHPEQKAESLPWLPSRENWADGIGLL